MPVLLIKTPIGPLLLVSDGRALTHVLPPQDARVSSFLHGDTAPNALTRRAAVEIADYFAGTRCAFDLPIKAAGTPFCRRVWQALSAVPFGQTVTYGQLAARIGLPNGKRAVGAAVGKNPLLLLIPCHRVVAENGLGGFLLGQEVKRTLLQAESQR